MLRARRLGGGPWHSVNGREPHRSGLGAALKAADLGMRFVIACVAGAVLGYLLDRWFGFLERFPVLTFVGLIVGFAAGMTALIRSVKDGGEAGGGPQDGDRND